jgi:methylmalonyl-CoA/ethylmalonyl-CoA epimerase
MISRIDHVSIAVNDYDKAVVFFQKLLGAVPGASGKDNGIHYLWHVLSAGDLSRIELISPTEKGSFLDGFLAERRDGGVHHITFETPDIKATKNHLDEVGIPYFGYQDTREQWKELFIHPKIAFGILIQIAEFNPDDYLANSEKFTTGDKWVVENRDDQTSLTFSHPGGGKFHIELNKAETEQLIADLKKV